MKKAIIIKLIVVYSILLGLTAMPLLFNIITQNNIVRISGRMFTYLLMAGIVLIFYKNRKNILRDFGYSSDNIGKQILMGGLILIITLSIFVLIPLLAGIDKEAVLQKKQTDIINILGQIIFFMLFVGPIEEFVFRGYFQKQLEKVLSNKIIICITVSLLFGFWHFPSTMSIVNVICTFVIGFIYSIFKTKFKNCTMLSVSLAHGLHDTIIFILSCVLL
ncbi:MAG: CPBP family intramembrane glutamic endopeptidase [Eubacteriales bacterium]